MFKLSTPYVKKYFSSILTWNVYHQWVIRYFSFWNVCWDSTKSCKICRGSWSAWNPLKTSYNCVNVFLNLVDFRSGQNFMPSFYTLININVHISMLINLKYVITCVWSWTMIDNINYVWVEIKFYWFCFYKKCQLADSTSYETKMHFLLF